MFPPAAISRSYLRWFNTSAEIVIWQKATVIETKQSHWAEQKLCHTRMFHCSSALCWRQCHCLWQSWRGFIYLIKIILINRARDSLVLKKHWLIIELDWLWHGYTELFPFRQSSSWFTNIILIKQITPLKDKLSSATNSDTIPDTALGCDPTFLLRSVGLLCPCCGVKESLNICKMTKKNCYTQKLIFSFCVI